MRLQSRPLYARFVKHVSVPDGSELAADEPFTKTWRFRNEGTMAWPADVGLLFISKLTGDQMGAPEVTSLGRVVQPGEEVDISVAMLAPSRPGHYQAYFRLSQGPKKFGQRVWVKINVVSSASEATSATTSTSASTSSLSSSSSNVATPATISTPSETGVEKAMAYAHISTPPSPSSLPSPLPSLSVRTASESKASSAALEDVPAPPAVVAAAVAPTLIVAGPPAATGASVLPAASSSTSPSTASSSQTVAVSSSSSSSSSEVAVVDNEKKDFSSLETNANPTSTSATAATTTTPTVSSASPSATSLLNTSIAMDSSNAYTLVNEALKQLQELGFGDSARNLRLIENHRGNLDAVVRELLGEF